MDEISKISIITPCFNAERLISETMESVLNQSVIISKKVELEYIICDGGSKDRTVEIINSFQSESISLISEKDNGMYDALAKGLKRATGDVIAYLNAGDLYFHKAFEVVIEIMGNYEVLWLTGLNITYNEKSQLISMNLPFRYRRKFIKAGLYNRKVLPHIQQESTFWRKELNFKLDLEQLTKFRYAGDYYIWNSFSDIADLNVVYTYLGGFKKHKDQLSSNRDQYIKEKEQIINPNKFLKLLAYFEKPLWYLPPSLKKQLNKKNLFKYDAERNFWR